MTGRGGEGTERRLIPEIRPAALDEAAAAATLHVAALPDGFLSSLGPSFLTLLYRRIATSESAQLLVAVDGHRVTGFVAVAESTRSLYREFLQHDALRAVPAAIPSLVRHPHRIWETLRYGTAEPADLPSAEILAVAVDPADRQRGLGRALTCAAVQHLRDRGVDGAKVVTASDNHAAQHMYEAAGFVSIGSAEVHAGTHQRVLVCR